MIKRVLNLSVLMICIICVFQIRTHAVNGSANGLKWNYDTESCCLTVSGNGEMENFSSVSEVPWYEYRSSIRTVNIEPGVTTIGTWAFSGCASLTNVNITDSIEAIYGAAFHGCTNLVKVTFKGTELYWNRIKVGKYNEYFTSAAHSLQSPDHVHKFASWETATPAAINKSGELKASCYICEKVSVKEVIPAIKSVSKDNTYFFYTGKENSIKLKITDTNGDLLVAGTDYTVTFEDKINFGKHKATVIFKGKYTGSYSFYYHILPSTVTNVKSVSKLNSITLSWNKVKGATGYRIYIYDSATKTYSILVRKTLNVSYDIHNLKPGRSYVFLVRAYTKYGDSYYYSRSSAKIITCTKVEKCDALKAVQSTSAVALTWNKVYGATGYRIFLYNSSTKSYTALKTTANSNYKCENLKPAKAYIFAVRAYKRAGETIVWSDIATLCTATKPVAPSSLTAQASINAVTLSWKSSQGATGYRVYSYDFKNKKYVPLKVVNTNKITIYSLTGGKSYVFLVRPYVAVGNEIVWGKSTKITVTTQKDSPSAVVIASSGSKYHRPGCSRAKNIKEKLTVNAAVKRGYTACSYCF